MLPVIMLAAQLLSKQEQEQEARKREVAHLMQQRAQRLGANTMGADAANFNRELANKTWATPDELLKIYSSTSGKGKPSDGATSTTPGSDGLLNPWGPGNGGASPDYSGSSALDSSTLGDSAGSDVLGSGSDAAGLLADDDPYGMSSWG